uniref:Nuclear receptor domain-containing protein n=1 Tax=Meloidogyne enterolobii TaxID=390850 RepID=A0A6V7TJE6_MELEN|nr:unnamed protein product [Meloidogyne enterolobii]
MKLVQQTQISSSPKIKKPKQGRTTLPLELLVDVFRTINTYSDGFPTDLALDTDIAIIKAKHQELWSKYAKKMMTSSLIIYSFMGEVFRLAKDSVGTSALACGSEEVCTDPKCQNMISALEGRISALENSLAEAKQLLLNCKCKKTTLSTSNPPRECRICHLLENCGLFGKKVLSCKSCIGFFRANTRLGGVSKRCRYQHGQCAALEPGAIRMCTSCRWVKCLNEGMRMEDVGERGTKRPAAEDLDVGTMKLHPGSSQEKP